jgi:hypothetical protein
MKSLVRCSPIESVFWLNADVIEEIPGDNHGLFPALQSLKGLSQRDTLRAMRCVKPADAVVQTRFNDRALRVFRRTRFVPELADEAVAAKNKGNVVFK